MPREKKYTKTIAFRITTEEWELIEHGMIMDGCHKPSDFIRKELLNTFNVLRAHRDAAARKAEFAAKRAAKKAAANANA